MKKQLSYKDVVLVPKFSTVESRVDVDTTVKFGDAPCRLLGDFTFKSPVIPANMKCCIDPSKAKELGEAGYFYILHRFLPYNEILHFIRCHQHDKNFPISISVGVQQKDRDLLDEIYAMRYRVDYITIDVAHGHHASVRDMIETIKEELLLDTFVIAGNVGTEHAALDLQSWGADAIKVGLSMGAACTTYNNTGVGSPMFSTVWDIAESVDVPVIADGQVREVGDICKALAAGADMVMVGSMFAACKDSPAPEVQGLPIITPNTITGKCLVRYEEPTQKYYFGNASRRNKKESGQKPHFIEGMEKKLDIAPYTMLEFMDVCNDGIRSCCSYGGYHSVEHLSAYRMEYKIIK